MYVVYREAVIPVIFALLTNKTEPTYRHLIEKLCEFYLSWDPKYLRMYFEKAAAMNVFADKFTANTNSSSTSGCFLHLQNSIQCKVQVGN